MADDDSNAQQAVCLTKQMIRDEPWSPRYRHRAEASVATAQALMKQVTDGAQLKQVFLSISQVYIAAIFRLADMEIAIDAKEDALAKSVPLPPQPPRKQKRRK